MRKILLVTLCDQMNLGNRLQNYALQTILQFLGYEVTNLIHIKNNSYFINLKIKKIIKLCLAKAGVKHFQDSLKREKFATIRKDRFIKFSNQFIKNQMTIGNNNITNIDFSIYDYAVTGSDQVWHNWKKFKGELEFFYLSFMPKKKRIAYAPSFGFSSFPLKDIERHKTGLLGMNFISCREYSGAMLINELVGRTVPIVIDPVFLLKIDDWNKIIKKPFYDIPERFMLVYFLGETKEEQNKWYMSLKNQRKLEVINIMEMQESDYYLTNPLEFIWLVKNAEYICTDSFHACAFSVLYHKEFMVFKRNGNGFEDMFDRIEGMLLEFGLDNYIYGKHYKKNIIWHEVDKVIQFKTEKSIEYLKTALSDKI